MIQSKSRFDAIQYDINNTLNIPVIFNPDSLNVNTHKYKWTN